RKVLALEFLHLFPFSACLTPPCVCACVLPCSGSIVSCLDLLGKLCFQSGRTTALAAFLRKHGERVALENPSSLTPLFSFLVDNRCVASLPALWTLLLPSGRRSTLIIALFHLQGTWTSCWRRPAK